MPTAIRTKSSALRRAVLGAILATAVTAIGLIGATAAHADPVDLQIVNRETGQPLQTWLHDGRMFVAGPPGARYALRVTNNTEDRVMIVLSVDGVNIITGETADPSQNGYIFKPHERYDLTGWRKTQTAVAAFTFAPLPQSYAARTGRAGEVGVIGLAMFREQPPAPPPPEPVVAPAPISTDAVPPPVRPHPIHRRRRWFHGHLIPPPPPVLLAPQIDVPMPIVAPTAIPPAPPPPAPMDRAATEVRETVVTAQKRSDKLGTAHGALEEDVMTYEPFERQTPYPQFTRQIEYDTYDNLVAAGVNPRSPPRPQPRPKSRRPQAFPAEPDNAGFVPDPPPGT